MMELVIAAGLIPMTVGRQIDVLLMGRERPSLVAE